VNNIKYVLRKVMPFFDILRSKRNVYNKPMTTKIKLVAIAKDEARYLPEWIFHHLRCGFDEIEVFINNTSDNTESVKQALSPLRHVKFSNGDEEFKKSKIPQVTIYKKSFKQAQKDGFSHVMFLDIDEFLVNFPLEGCVKRLVEEFSADVVVLEWLNRINEPEEFDLSIKPRLFGRRSRHVKSIVKTSVSPEKFNPHCVLAKNASYVLADGTKFVADPSLHYNVSDDEVKKPLKKAFVLHRMYRSEMEYISLLLKGRPSTLKKFDLPFKNNRDGYPRVHNYSIDIPPQEYLSYKEEFSEFLTDYSLHSLLIDSEKYILQRYHKVIDKIEVTDSSHEKLLKKILNGVNDPLLLISYNKFKDSILTKQKNCIAIEKGEQSDRE